MHGVTIHTIFWAPSGFRFSGSPGAGVLGYEPADPAVPHRRRARLRAAPRNLFLRCSRSIPDSSGPGGATTSSYDAGDRLDRRHRPVSALEQQCASPAGIATCITDLQAQRGDRPGDPGPRSRRARPARPLVRVPAARRRHCLPSGECGTNAFAGYHSLLNIGHGATIYSVVPDPLIEFTPPPGSDPQGNPEAESTLDTVAHETVEAITDPEGVGLDGPQRVRGGRQVRERARGRHAARLRHQTARRTTSSSTAIST